MPKRTFSEHFWTFTLLLLTSTFTLTLTSPSIEDYDYQVKFIKWGGKCKLPQQGELLLPQDGCDESRGMICQLYSQGYHCGCPIQSSFLSYDKASGECRRRPGEHCIFVNVTVNPHAYQNLPRHTKCHTNADCLLLTTQPESSSLTKGTMRRRNSSQTPDAKCYCKRGYFTDNSGRECVSVSASGKLTSGSVFVLLIITTIISGLL